jgi:hypothetical protein
MQKIKCGNSNYIFLICKKNIANKKCGKIKCENSNYIFLICKKNIANKKCEKIKCKIEVVEK